MAENFSFRIDSTENAKGDKKTGIDADVAGVLLREVASTSEGGGRLHCPPARGSF